MHRYLLVGGTMAVLYAAIVAVVHRAGFSGLAGSVVATCFVLPLSFTLQRKIAFRSSGPVRKQAAGYVAVTLFNIPLGWATVWLLVDVLHQNAFASGLIATGLAALVNYGLLSKVVFGDKEALVDPEC